MKLEGYVNLSKEHLESSLILLEAKKYRSSISSSYYAMFSIAKALLIKEGIVTSKHSGVTSFFGNT
ncbi:HEPN domain-containing protein [Methanosphaera sp. ISO3-F5]|uniref:HEPN domain-containing protein n=1 Tax=Methanosphaera sp. ISO3-F5 TaxID=1452353 RepID=UPI002B258747|nr:HEPN domain-containing protein [Methanosphaera sp. ISO3-F5]WQH63980.1 HEPN domain-containing protein [Methanosphaera sp. ISO3-F5]